MSDKNKLLTLISLGVAMCACDKSGGVTPENTNTGTNPVVVTPAPKKVVTYEDRSAQLVLAVADINGTPTQLLADLVIEDEVLVSSAGSQDAEVEISNLSALSMDSEVMSNGFRDGYMAKNLSAEPMIWKVYQKSGQQFVYKKAKLDTVVFKVNPGKTIHVKGGSKNTNFAKIPTQKAGLKIYNN